MAAAEASMTCMVFCEHPGPRENAPASAKYPAFREELVGTLLSALLAHHAGRLNALQGPGSKAQNGSAGPPDVADVLITAADMHARASLCDWTSAAKIALQVGIQGRRMSAAGPMVPSTANDRTGGTMRHGVLNQSALLIIMLGPLYRRCSCLPCGLVLDYFAHCLILALVKRRGRRPVWGGIGEMPLGACMHLQL